MISVGYLSYQLLNLNDFDLRLLNIKNGSSEILSFENNIYFLFLLTG